MNTPCFNLFVNGDVDFTIYLYMLFTKIPVLFTEEHAAPNVICTGLCLSKAPSFTLELFTLRLDTCVKCVVSLISVLLAKSEFVCLWAVEYSCVCASVSFFDIKILIHKHLHDSSM